MDNQIQDKIAGLLRLATNNSNLNEANAAMLQAQRLAEKYRIDIASVSIDKTSTVVEPIEQDNRPFISGGRIRNWKVYLLNYIVTSQGCACFSTRSERSHYGETSYYCFGCKTDLSIARSMFDWALSELELIGTLACKGRGKVYANSWYTGAVDGINEALTRGKQQAREGVSTTAITIVDARAHEADKVMRTKQNLHSRTYSKPRLNAEAYYKGHDVGSKITFGKNLPK